MLKKGCRALSKKSADLSELQQIMQDAIVKKFDELLVFMFDRVGRLDKDSASYLEELVQRAGVEVWSVKMGQQKFEKHTDRLTNFIRFWQSHGERSLPVRSRR